MGQDDEVGLRHASCAFDIRALAGRALQHRVDADAGFGQLARDLGQHTGTEMCE